MNLIMQILINSLIAGSIYALIASGFSIIYSTYRFVHFAHGGTVALSAYLLYFFYEMQHVNFYISVTLTLITIASIGYVMELSIFRQLKKRNASNSILLIASLALLILIESFILLIFKSDVKRINFIEISKGVNIFGALITPLQISIIIISASLFFILYWYMKKTKSGKALRAVADNKEASKIIGIPTRKIYSLSFVLGSIISGIAGMLIGLEQNMVPNMGTSLIIKGFTGAVIGGIGNVYASILGSILLGIAENFGVWFIPSGYKDAIAFVILIIFLFFRPQGIFGIKGRIYR